MELDMYRPLLPSQTSFFWTLRRQPEGTGPLKALLYSEETVPFNALMFSPFSNRGREGECTKLHFHCSSSGKDLYVTYHVSLLSVQFLTGHFSSQHDAPSGDWSSLRVSRYLFFYFFLHIFPLLFTKYFFFIPLLLSMALGQPNLGRNLFSTFLAST